MAFERGTGMKYTLWETLFGLAVRVIDLVTQALGFSTS